MKGVVQADPFAHLPHREGGGAKQGGREPDPLAGILFSATRNMIASGKTAKATANLRQIGVLTASYTADNNGSQRDSYAAIHSLMQQRQSPSRADHLPPVPKSRLH